MNIPTILYLIKLAVCVAFTGVALGVVLIGVIVLGYAFLQRVAP